MFTLFYGVFSHAWLRDYGVWLVDWSIASNIAPSGERINWLLMPFLARRNFEPLLSSFACSIHYAEICPKTIVLLQFKIEYFKRRATAKLNLELPSIRN
jgi:hypothetical protein